MAISVTSTHSGLLCGSKSPLRKTVVLIHYLLSTNSMPGTVLGAGETDLKKKGFLPFFRVSEETSTSKGYDNSMQ